MNVIDAHCHFWTLERGDYGWLQGVEPELAPLRRDFTPDDMPGDSPVIAVQAAPTLAETNYLLQLSSPRIAGVVGWVDLTEEGSRGTLADLATRPRFRGIRPMLQDIPETDWILVAPRPDIVALLANYHLSFDALITTRHLKVMEIFARQNPDLDIVIDHAAKPDLSTGTPETEWIEGMERLAAIDKVFCKFSGLLNLLTPEQRRDPVSVLRPVFARLLEWFGPERLIWGSDWPVVDLAGGYNRWLGVTNDLIADLSDGERAAIMGGNAQRFYGLSR